MKLRGRMLALAVLMLGMMLLPRPAAAETLQAGVKALSLAPQTESRYTITFAAEEQLNLSAGTAVEVTFPQEYSFIQNDIFSGNPGLTLATIQYKNPADKNYSVLDGQVSWVAEGGAKKIRLAIAKGNNMVEPKVEISLVIPGIVNPAAKGGKELQLKLESCDGKTYGTAVRVEVGDPPSGTPANLRLSAPTSGEIFAVWDAVEGATRYQLVYSRDPQGQFILACDFGKEPLPGEEWLLSGTQACYSGTGNGGLAGGQTYYFKIRAGNDYGYGPYSRAVAVTTPVVKVVGCSAAAIGAASPSSSKLKVKLDQPVKVLDAAKICIYEQDTGNPVSKVEVLAQGEQVVLTAALIPGKQYQVVCYEGALESKVSGRIYNNFWGATLTAPAQGSPAGGAK